MLLLCFYCNDILEKKIAMISNVPTCLHLNRSTNRLLRLFALQNENFARIQSFSKNGQFFFNILPVYIHGGHKGLTFIIYDGYGQSTKTVSLVCREQVYALKSNAVYNTFVCPTLGLIFIMINKRTGWPRKFSFYHNF